MSRASRTITWLGGGSIVAVIVAAVVVMTIRHFAHERLIAYKESLVSMGEELDLAKLVPTPPSAGRNDTEGLAAACLELNRLLVEKQTPKIAADNVAKSPGRRSVMHRREKAIVSSPSNWRRREIPWEEAIAPYQELVPIFERMRKAAESPLALMRPGSGPGSAVALQMSGMKASEYLQGYVIYSLAKGDMEAAMNGVEASLAVAMLFREQLDVLSMSVATACVTRVQVSTWEILQSRNVSAADLLMLQKLWERVDLTSGLAMTFRVNRARDLQVFDSLRGQAATFFRLSNYQSGWNTGWYSFKQGIFLLAWEILFRDADELGYLTSYQKLLESAEASQASGAWSEALNSLKFPERTSRNNIRSLEQDILPQIIASSRRIVSTQALANMTTCAIALQRYRVDHAAYPDSLEELVPHYIAEIPRDPFDGNTLRYHPKNADEFLLYSIGSDEQDEGGNTESLHKGIRDFLSGKDIVWPMVE